MTYLWSGMIIIGIIYGALTGNFKAVTEAAVSSGKDAVALCISMAGIVAMWSGLMKIAQMSGMVERLAGKMRPVLRFLFPDLDPESEPCKYISLNFLSNILGLGWAATPAGLKAMESLAELELSKEKMDETEKWTDRNEVRTEGRKEKEKGNKIKNDEESRKEDKERNKAGSEKESRKENRTSKQKGEHRSSNVSRVASKEMCTFLIINISSLQLIPVNMIAYRSQYGSADPAAVVGPGILATAVSTAVAVIFCRIMNRRGRNV